MSKYAYAWDESLKEGDLITAYEAGYHLVIRIEPRDPSSSHSFSKGKPIPPLVVYQRVISTAGNPVKGAPIKKCDASYCRKLTPEVIDQMRDDAIARANEQWANLQKYAHK